jgi:transposase
MRQTTGTRKSTGEKLVKDIKRATRKHYSSKEKIRVVLDGLRGEDSIAELCRREGISQGIYYKWSKDVMEAGKRRLAGDTARAANTDEVKDLRRETRGPGMVKPILRPEYQLQRLGAVTPDKLCFDLMFHCG